MQDATPTSTGRRDDALKRILELLTDTELAQEINRRNRSGRHLFDHAEGWVSE